MTLLVQKFGGTSVGSIERLQHVANTVIRSKQQGHDVVVVVSAMGKETDRLIDLIGQASSNPNPREYDVAVSTGEQLSMALLALMLNQHGYPARSYTGLQAGIQTDNLHKKAHIMKVDSERIITDLSAGNIVVVAGFQGYNQHGDITTLGRGGSDTTAVALAAALKAQECQIFTDVDGVYTVDPRVVPTARLLDSITFEEMLEMADLGANVLQNRAVRYAGRYQVPLRVLSSFSPGSGTLITYEDDPMEKPVVSGIAFNRSEAKITLFGVPSHVDVISMILEPIANANIDVDMILQNPEQQDSINFTFTVNREDYQRAMSIVDVTAKKLKARDVKGDKKIAKLSIVGVGMRSHTGVASTMFKALSREGIMVQLVSTSEIKTSVVIDEKYLELGAKALHTAFALDKAPHEEFDPAPMD